MLALQCGTLSITILVSLLANEFDVRSVLHGNVILAAVNQVCVIHEAMNICKNLKILKGLLRKCKIVHSESPSYMYNLWFCTYIISTVDVNFV